MPTNGQDHAELFRMLATAVQDHLHGAVDADTVRQIVDDRIARLPDRLGHFHAARRAGRAAILVEKH